MENLKMFQYEGSPVTFKKENGMVMVNATEMAKPFGDQKSPRFFLRLQSTKDYIETYTAVHKNHTVDSMVVTTSGGVNGGGATWMHEDLAIEFSRWLSPKFSLWCNDRIKELLTIGMTALPHTLDEMISNPDLVIALATQLKEERAKKEIAETKVKELAPKGEFYDDVAKTEGLLSMQETAKTLKLGSNKLFQILRERKVFLWDNNRNVPSQAHVDAGLFKVVISKYSIGRPTKDNEKNQIYTRIFVTPKGIEWLHKKLRANGYLQVSN